MSKEIIHSPYIRCDSVLSQICFDQIVFKCCYHILLILNEYGNNIRRCIEHYENLPNGWCYASIKEVFKINPRNKADDSSKAGFISMTNISDGYFNTFRYETRQWYEVKTGFTHFADGDIAVAKISPCLENRKSIILKDLPNGIGAGTTELYIFRSQCIDAKYGLFFFKSDYFINQCINSFNGVVGQQRVSKSIIEDIDIAIPPLEEQM